MRRLFQPDFPVEPYTYRGEHLREIAFPLGGIGTGCVSLDGRGGLRDWEIYGRPNKNTLLETTFPALWVKPEGGPARAVVVHGPRVRDWVGEAGGFWGYGHGRYFAQMDGLPGFDAVSFEGTFPVARLRFEKAGFPLQVELAAFSPLIPLDERASSFPAACLVYRLTNRTDTPIDLTLAWSVMNPVGEGTPPTADTPDQARQEFLQDGNLSLIQFRNTRFGPSDAAHGTVALSTPWPDCVAYPQWTAEGWWDSIATFWNVFRETGRFPSGTPHDGRASGSLGACAKLNPGESVEIPFLLSWVFPTSSKYWGNEDPRHTWTPWYATQWPDAQAVAREFFGRFQELTERTLAFEHALFDTTLPAEVVQSVSATASTLHSPTILRLEDGTYWAWEGCSPHEGCCTGSCTHVWNYALTHAWLFPKLQENMRRADYRNNFRCGPEGQYGALNFRLALPLGQENPLWHAASDGQLGGVVQLYRDWRLTGDEAMLRDLWPSAKRALEFAWRQWDRDRDGLVDGDQHNTYDINFQGPNPLTQFFYLAALRAGERMARHLGDADSAETYRALHEQGATLTAQRLWNGDYFVQEQTFEGPGSTRYQHGHGCLSDQLFGQLQASLAGLGHLVEPELVRAALQAIFRHNYRDPLGDHENLQRVYAVADEPGLILCSWPHGKRPDYPFPYSDEVWSGFEYQVATHLALEGFREEAVQIARGVRKRHDGTRRNPWNEFECGSHYARAMSAYGLLLALSGLRYDAVERTAELGFDGKFLVSTPSGWGSAERVRGETTFSMVEGTLFPGGLA